MPSARADRARAGRTRAGQPSRGAAANRWIALTAAVLTLALLGGCSSDVEIEPPQATNSAGSLADQAPALLKDLEGAINGRETADAMTLATPESAGLLRSLVANARELDLAGVQLRLVTDGPPISPDEADRLPTNAELVTVSVRYRVGGWDLSAAQVETTVVLVPDGERALVHGFGVQGDRTPLWLTGRLAVRSADRVLVLASGPSVADRLLGQGRAALRAVRQVLPDWRGRLVLEAPGSQAALDAALSAEPDQYANIAAVTTTVDGSLREEAPVRVFVNPEVFGKLGPKGQQVVISHEATHVATRATFTSLPTWLSEGFADYVALAHAGVPLETAAGQILDRVREDGPPEGLPTPQDLQPTAGDLGATYELAWLACRFIALEYGERRLVAFYEAVSAGRSVADAFEQQLGVTEAAFVRAWRADVVRLAGR